MADWSGAERIKGYVFSKEPHWLFHPEHEPGRVTHLQESKKTHVFHVNNPEAPSYLDPTTWMDSKPKSFTTFRSLQNNFADFSWKKKSNFHISAPFWCTNGQSCFQCFQRSQRRGNLVKETGPHCCWPQLSPTQKKCPVKLFHVQSCN